MPAQQSPYLQGAPLGNVSLYQSARVEIGIGHRSSRSSRIVSDKGFPLMRTGERQIGIGPRFKAGRNIPSASSRLIALSLSDSFVVDRHRAGLIGFIDSEVDIVFANEDEITALFETKDFDTAVKAIGDRAKIAAVTRGAKGSVVIAGGAVHEIEAFPVQKVLDTTGAGDQYAAGFLYGLAKGHAMDHCGRLGSLAAAEVIAHYGPRPQVSLRDLAASAGL